jgi:hypothetical protein
LLLSLAIEPHEVIKSITDYITEKEFTCTKQKKDTTLEISCKMGATGQSLICHFVYNYLLHSISNNFKPDVDDHGGDEGFVEISNSKNYTKLYENTMKFFKQFIYTRNPTTVTWLLEILYILSAKFKPEE